jgi:hypothetical protein
MPAIATHRRVATAREYESFTQSFEQRAFPSRKAPPISLCLGEGGEVRRVVLRATRPRNDTSKEGKITMGAKTNRIAENTADQQLAAGLTQNASRLGTLTVIGKPMQAADIVQVLQARIAARAAATQAHVTLQAAVAALQDEVANTRALVRAVKQLLRAMFANDAATLGTFGIAVPVPKPRLASAKAASAAKAKATKAAGGKKAATKAAATTEAAPAAAAAPTAKPQS